MELLGRRQRGRTRMRFSGVVRGYADSWCVRRCRGQGEMEDKDALKLTKRGTTHQENLYSAHEGHKNPRAELETPLRCMWTSLGHP